MARTNNWLDKIKKEIETERKDSEISQKIIELISELRVHQSELEMQNEELSQSQQEYAELYNKYFELYNDVPVGYFTLDFDGIIRNVNVRGVELLKLDKGLIIGRGFSKFILKTDEYKYFMALLDSIDSGKNQELEIQLKRDKKHFNAHMEVMPIFYRDGSRYRIIITDITKHKKSEEALKEVHDNLELKVKERTNELNLANKYNRSLIEASLDPLVTIGSDGKINDVNIATELVTGYSRDELIGTDFSNYFIEPEKAEIIYQKVFKKGEVHDYPLEIKNKNGDITPVVYNASIFKDVDGNVIGVFAAARDITKLKKSEEQLKQTINELQRSNKELQSFAYITSHDLQEPLRTIASFTQLLERRYHGKLDENADEFMDYIVDAAKRMKDMIQGLLDYSRVDTQGESFREFNSEEAVNQALNHLLSSADECHAKISYENLPMIIGDEHQITRVFQNLVGNALKFRKEGVSPEIQISAEKNDGEYIFSVADNGIGMEEEYSKNIFEPFKRLHPIDTFKGTGIGLAVVKRIIEHHGGRIWFDSKLGEGTTFYFTLPVEPVETGGGAFSKIWKD